MEDLTVLLPKKIRVGSDENAIVPCPFCGKVLSISSKQVYLSGRKDHEIICKCRNTFFVKFEIKKRSITELKITITDLTGNHALNNISILQLSQNHLNFICRDHHQLNKGHKLRIQFLSATSDFFETKGNAVVRLVHGRFISCYFIKAVDLPYATESLV